MLFGHFQLSSQSFLFDRTNIFYNYTKVLKNWFLEKETAVEIIRVSLSFGLSRLAADAVDNDDDDD